MRINLERPDPAEAISAMSPAQLSELDQQLDEHNARYGVRAFSESIINKLGANALNSGLFLERQIQRNDLRRQADLKAQAAQ